MVVEDVSGPEPAGAGHVIVRPEAVGICGSDFHLYSGDVGALSGVPRVPEAAVFGVGDLDPDCAAFVETASVVMHAVARGQVRAGEQAVVFGAGPIGLATVLAAVSAGARVLSIDPVSPRRDLAKRLGAEEVVWADYPQAVLEWTRGEGPPLIVETSGEASVLPRAVEMVAAAGRIVVIGMSSGSVPMRPGVFPAKEIDVIGSSCATAGDFRAAIRLVSAHRGSLAALFSHHFPLTRVTEAFEFAMARPPDAIKVVVTVDEDTH